VRSCREDGRHRDTAEDSRCAFVATRRAPRVAGYLQYPFVLHVPSVGGSGQSAALVHAFVQMFIIMIFWHEL
jgi:hypothetical protein